MRRIEDVKKGLACHALGRNRLLACSDCAYHGPGLPPCGKAVHEDASAMLEQLAAQVPKWISVEEPPARPGFYLVMIQGAKQATMLWWSICGEWYDNPAITYRVTHWMPLPVPPKEDTE